MTSDMQAKVWRVAVGVIGAQDRACAQARVCCGAHPGWSFDEVSERVSDLLNLRGEAELAEVRVVLRLMGVE